MDTVRKYLKESTEIEYDLTYDDSLDKDVKKLVKKYKGDMDEPEFNYGDARTNAYVDKKYAKRFEKDLDKLGVDWS